MTATTKDRQQYQRLRTRVQETINDLSDGISSGLLSPVEWHNEMVELLRVGYTAAYMAGRETTEVSPAAQRMLSRLVGGQVDYLNRFLDEIEASEWNDATMRPRAQMYGKSTRQGFERGLTYGLDLPQVPGDGKTECLTNCKCSLRVRWIDEEELDADVYWLLGSAEHCESCVRLSKEWRPLRIRGGEVQG